MSRPAVPPQLHGLLDDAAPSTGTGSVGDALRAHDEHRRSAYADLVGPLVVADSTLPELVVQAAAPPRPGGLEVLVVVSGGAGAVQPAVAWAARDGVLALRGLQVAVRESDAGDLAPNARRIVTAVDSLVVSGALDEEVPVYVQPPRWHGSQPSASWLAALDEVAAMDHRLALRAGGPDDSATGVELAICIAAALDRELPFRCTPGPDHAVRQRDPATGSEQHGFLNVLLATRAGLDGAGTADVAAVLEETDADVLLSTADEPGLASARRWFVSSGSGDLPQAAGELSDLGLLGDRT